jgi:hypothetical protein
MPWRRLNPCYAKAMANETTQKGAGELAYAVWRKTLVLIPAGDQQAFLAEWQAAKRDERRRQ